MAVTIEDIISQRVFPNMKMVAGRKGAKNEIIWVNIMEILDMPETVQPGEILFSTGCGLENENAHSNLISTLEGRGVSALVIQTGFYIEKIPQYIIEKADELNFPVLQLPKNFTFSEILHTMIQIISPEHQRNWDSNILRQSYTFLEKSLNSKLADVFGSNEIQNVQILLLSPVNFTNVDEKIWKKCTAQLNSFILSCSDVCLYNEMSQHKFVLITTHRSHESCLTMLYELNIKLTFISEQHGANYYMGTEQLNSPDELMATLNRANQALETLQLIQARRGLCSYDNIRFVKMFGHLHRKDSSVVLDNQSLQMLLSYDKQNNTNYVYTLRIYLSNNGNMTQAAKQLFVHRHTLIKRLEKIASIGCLDLEDYYTRIYMSVALLFHDYFIY